MAAVKQNLTCFPISKLTGTNSTGVNSSARTQMDSIRFINMYLLERPENPGSGQAL
jgi:hypothetical protein